MSNQKHAYPPGTGPLYAEIPAALLEALRHAAFERRPTKNTIVIAALERELADELAAQHSALRTPHSGGSQ